MKNNTISLQTRILRSLFLLLGLIFVYLNPVYGQNYYVRLSDVSGLTPTQAQLDSLESAACRLRDSLPTAFQSAFKVYDFGFYLHNETMVGGYPEAFQKAIDLAQAGSPYYLLFGKQTDKNGVYTRFWVDLKLPTTGIFTCLTPITRSLITEQIRFVVDEKYTKDGRSSNLYSDAIIVGIKELKAKITNIYSGICCESDPKKIYNVLINQGFASFSCKILSNSAAITSNNTAGKSMGEVLDFAYLDIEEAGAPNDINSSLKQIISGLVGAGLISKGYITKNENICDSSKFEIARNLYSASLTDFDVWFHLWKNPDNSGDDILFVKSEKLDEIANYFQTPTSAPWYPLTKSLLVTHVMTKCPPTIEINNFIGENVFEETWHEYAFTNFSTIFFYSANREKFSGGCRSTVPDGLATSYTPASNIAFTNASWYEVKASMCDVYLSSYENQIKAHIQNLQISQPNACINNAAWFNIITTSGVEVSSSVYRYAGGFRIKVLHWEAWYQYNTNGKMEVKFGIKTALNRLAPSIFPPDFLEVLLGYIPVLLQNCD
jgi:hypothetical protein